MEILEHSLVERIIDEALSVLEDTGVLDEHDEAFEPSRNDFPGDDRGGARAAHRRGRERYRHRRAYSPGNTGALRRRPGELKKRLESWG